MCIRFKKASELKTGAIPVLDISIFGIDIISSLFSATLAGNLVLLVACNYQYLIHFSQAFE
jgi:uncharacterized membrane protein